MDQEFVIHLAQGDARTFTAAAQIREWVSDELKYWVYLNAPQSAAYAAYRAALKPILGELSSNPSSEQVRSEIIPKLEQAYTKLIHRESQIALSLEKTRTTEPNVAAAAVAALLKVEVANAGTSAAVRGVVKAAMLEEGMPTSAAIEYKRYESLVQRVRADHENWGKEIEQRLMDAKNQEQELRRTVASTRGAYEQVEAARQSEFMSALHQRTEKADAIIAEMREAGDGIPTLVDRQIKLAQKQIADFKAALEQRTLSQEPRKYWEEKRLKHRTLAIAFGCSFLAWVLALVAFTLYLPSITVGGAPLLTMETDWPRIPIGRLVLVGVVLTCGLWVAKTLARLMLSNLHLYTDAGLRVVMVESYLALIKAGATATPDDRRVILESLFRPSSTGIVRDDANPPNWFIAATRERPN